MVGLVNVSSQSVRPRYVYVIYRDGKFARLDQKAQTCTSVERSGQEAVWVDTRDCIPVRTLLGKVNVQSARRRRDNVVMVFDENDPSHHLQLVEGMLHLTRELAPKEEVLVGVT